MVPRVYAEYTSLFRSLTPRPRSALEVGALPSNQCLLVSPELRDIPVRTGINLNHVGEYDGVQIVRGDARSLEFDDGTFDLVLCNAVLEHVPDFWRACDEMKRVLAPGGHLVVSTPGFHKARWEGRVHRWAATLRLPDVLRRCTMTMRVHDAPDDYYRFSEYAYKNVIMSGLSDVRIWTIMTVPRVFGIGSKPIEMATE